MTHPLDRQLLFVTGKGGVGKTTVAAAAGIAAAARGRRTIVVETLGQARLPRLFGRSVPTPGLEVPLADRLSSLTVDPAVGLEEYVAHQLHSRSLVRVLTHSNAFRSFVDAAPGAKELIAIAKAWELVQAHRWDRRSAPYDLVVVDAPASGHGLGLLRTPRTFGDIARVGPLHTQAVRVREWLEDPRRSGYLVVALAAEMPVTETLEVEGRLRHALGRDVETIVVNALLPRRFAARELQELDDLPADGTILAAGRAAARSHAARVRGQQAELQRLRRTARAPVGTLPFVPCAALELDDVRGLADRLAVVVGGG